MLKKSRSLLCVSASVCALLSAIPAYAQNDKADKSGAPDTIETVVVTGTLIRGAAPIGSQLLTVSSQDITATGATSTNQLLASIPQIGNFFNNLPQIVAGTNNHVQVNRPNLRHLPSGNTSSGAATLILVDGHRVVGAGVSQDAPDPDIIAPGAIERVEIIPDGASSTYGADAIGGVINFITRKRFDGLQVSGRVGAGDSYTSFDGTATFGRDWGSGSAYISYNYSHHDSLLGGDRNYVKRIDWNTGIPSDRYCTTPNILVGSNIYASSTSPEGTFNACDLSKYMTMYPEQTRHSVFAGLTQDLTSWLHFDLKVFYTQRHDTSNQGPAGVSVGAVSVSPTNPFYQNLTGTSDANATQNVEFNWGPALGYQYGLQTTQLDEWGVTPTVTADLFGDWQLRAMFNYGHSETSYFTRGLNPTLISQYAAGTTTSTAINPYDIANTPNQQLITDIANWADQGQGDAGLSDWRAIADGSLFALPAGKVHAAVGIEYITDSFSVRDAPNGTTLGGLSAIPVAKYSRNVKSVFSEVQIPVFGEGFRLPLVDSFSVDASFRYDDYSDFGSTVNPKVGVEYRPIDWIKLRGNWGTSFNAPTPVDELGATHNSVLAQNFFVKAPVGQTPPPGAYNITLLGTAPNLQPQTAETQSYGIDVSPPFIPGLTADMSYWRITYKGILGQPPVFNPATFFAYYPSFYILNPTAAQISAFVAGVPGGAAQVARFLAPGGPQVYELWDYRLTNLGNAVISGLDWNAHYTHDVSFGTVFGNFHASYLLKDSRSAGPGSPYVSQINAAANSTSGSRFDFALTAGVDFGRFLAQATWNHSQGYPILAEPDRPQTRVDSFNTVDTYFSYNLDGTGWLQDSQVTLNVQNLFDQDPPVYKLTGQDPGQPGGGFANGATLGRVVLVGVVKNF